MLVAVRRERLSVHHVLILCREERLLSFLVCSHQKDISSPIDKNVDDDAAVVSEGKCIFAAAAAVEVDAQLKIKRETVVFVQQKGQWDLRGEEGTRKGQNGNVVVRMRMTEMMTGCDTPKTGLTH